MSNFKTTYGGFTTPQQTNFFENKRNKRILIITLIILVLFGALWIWKAIQINTIKKEAKKEKEELRSNALRSVININREYMRLLAMPYAWAIRTEMLQGDINQVNQYANQMIKEKNFQSIVVADGKGVIISSTNKKFEGKDFTIAGKRSYLAGDSIIVDKINEHLIAVSSPIMGLNNRLGTLLITYNVTMPETLK